MNYNEIIEDITKNLTGDTDKDLAYLNEQQQIYKDHEEKEEILRGIGKIRLDIMPEEMKKELQRKAVQDLRNKQEANKVLLNEIILKLKNKEPQKALEIVEKEIEKFEKINPYKNDETKEFYTFSQPFDEVLYRFKFKPTAKLMRPVEPIADWYYLKGVALKTLGRGKEAIESLSTASRWNPVAAGIWLEYADYIREEGDLDTFMDIVEKTFEYAYLPQDISRCYTGFARFYYERGRMDTAIACLQFAIMFMKTNPQAAILHKLIAQQTGGKIKPMPQQEIQEVLLRNKLPDKPDKDIMGLAMAWGKKFYDEHNKSMALYYYSIAFNITHDKTVKALLDEVNAW